MEEHGESMKRLELHAKRHSSRIGGEEETSEAGVDNSASQETVYVGSMVGQEEAFPDGIRRRVIEPPVGPRLGYHELGDEREEGDVDWMLGEASQLSGAGTRGSRNWLLKIMLPITLIVGIICMHQWWTDIKRSFSNLADTVGDAFDRRALSVAVLEGEKDERYTSQGFAREHGGFSGDKTGVYQVDFKDVGLDTDKRGV